MIGSTCAWLVSGALLGAALPSAAGEIQEATLAGYLIMPDERVENSYDAGFSMYVAAWPLLEQYPGSQFQTGLASTWMFAQYDEPHPEKLYSDIEGGLGWWRDTRFATATPKFIMGGVAREFSAWANGPGAGKGRDWDRPQGKYAVVQLSPWLLWPPDGVNLEQGACGELVGYGYLPLPLTQPKSTTAGKDVPTGDNCWTLFLNTANFKGPATFFAPYFWSRASVEDADVGGMFLDSRPSDPNRSLQMETQYIPAAVAADSEGQTYARIAPTDFPAGPTGESVLAHKLMSYTKEALWDGVEDWFQGGPAATGAVDSQAASAHAFPGRSSATWRIYTEDTPKEDRAPVDWDAFATAVAPDSATFGFQWHSELTTTHACGDSQLVRLPEYYHLTEVDGESRWQAIPVERVPAETGLAEYTFTRPTEPTPDAYVTPDDEDSSWKNPGPVAGPFQVNLGDGSLVTYSWYRFADQPALLNADMTDEEREGLQARVEKLHRLWQKDGEYLAPPDVGELASIDPALLMTPPAGLEVGYVPIVTRQEPTDRWPVVD